MKYNIIELEHLRRTSVDIMTTARELSKDYYDRKAIIAFEAGDTYYPPCFEYGLGAGNPRTHLGSEIINGKICLIYYQTVPEYRIRKNVIAMEI